MKIIRLEARPDVIGRLRNANETDRESRNAVVGPLAHLDRADSVAKSNLFWTRTPSSRPGHRGGCLDPAGAIGRADVVAMKKAAAPAAIRRDCGIGSSFVERFEFCFGVAKRIYC
jgi:hypothetical protein